YSSVDSHVPRGCWRSTPHVANAFAVECFIDELAALAQMNPLEFRLKNLIRSSNNRSGFEVARMEKTLRFLADYSVAWKQPLNPREGRGVACHYSFGSYVAQVARV